MAVERTCFILQGSNVLYVLICAYMLIYASHYWNIRHISQYLQRPELGNIASFITTLRHLDTYFHWLFMNPRDTGGGSRLYNQVCACLSDIRSIEIPPHIWSFTFEFHMPLNGNSVAAERCSTLVKFGCVGVLPSQQKKLSEIVIVRCWHVSWFQVRFYQGKFAVDIWR